MLFFRKRHEIRVPRALASLKYASWQAYNMLAGMLSKYAKTDSAAHCPSAGIPGRSLHVGFVALLCLVVACSLTAGQSRTRSRRKPNTCQGRERSLEQVYLLGDFGCWGPLFDNGNEEDFFYNGNDDSFFGTYSKANS